MRSAILLGLMVLITVLGGGYCIAWFTQAAVTKNAVEHAIKTINQKQEYLTYESITTSGFPFNVNVSIVKPHFKGRVDEVLKAFFSQVAANPGEADAISKRYAAMPAWDADIQSDGSISVGINALSDHYDLRLNGNWQENSKIGEQAINYIYKSSGDTACAVVYQHSRSLFDSLWSFKLFNSDSKTFFKEFRMLDCASSDYVMTDTVTQALLSKGGPTRFYITSDPKDDKLQVRIYAKITDIEFTPQADPIMAAYYRAIAADATYPFQVSLYGKQNMELDFSYDGPLEPQPLVSNPLMTISLSKFNVNNALSTNNIMFYFHNGPSATTPREMRVALKADSNFTTQYDTHIRQLVEHTIKQVYAEEIKPKNLESVFQKYTPEELYSIVHPAIPNFSSLGKLVQSLDIHFNGEADFISGDINLADLELSASPYGVNGKGSAKIGNNRIPVGTTVLTCRNCPQMVDDITAYADRLQKTIAYFSPEKAASFTPITPQLVEGIKGFLNALADNNKDNVNNNMIYSYTITNDENMNFNINGKRLDQVMSMYNEYIKSAMAPN